MNTALFSIEIAGGARFGVLARDFGAWRAIRAIGARFRRSAHDFGGRRAISAGGARLAGPSATLYRPTWIHHRPSSLPPPPTQ